MTALIGVTGLCGVGKTTATKHFESRWGCERVYLGQIILDEVALRGLDQSSANERIVREALRLEMGPANLVQKSASRIATALQRNTNVVIDAVFNGDEYEYLRNLIPDVRFTLIDVVAPFDIRCARLGNRSERSMTEEDVRSRDKIELEKFDIARVAELSDDRVVNNGSKPEFLEKLDAIWKKHHSKT